MIKSLYKISRIKKWFDKSSPLFYTRLSLLVCIVLAFTGIILGTIEDSLAVQTNGLVSAIDVLNSLLFLAAVNQSLRSPDLSYNYGYGKYESFSVLTSSVLLFSILGYAVYETAKNYGSPSHTGNYYILILFALISSIIMRQTSSLQGKAGKKFGMPILNYDSDIWKIDSYIELGVALNLIIGKILNIYHFESIAKTIDSVTAIILLAVALKVPLKHGKDALNQLLDRTLPEYIQFDILAVIAENISRICEFKSVHTRRSGKDIFIEIDVIMPFDYTLEKAFCLEKDIQEGLKNKYPTAVSRLYVMPCARDCIHKDKRNCPVHSK